MDREEYEKLKELLIKFTNDCSDIGFEVFGTVVENTLELEIRRK